MTATRRRSRASSPQLFGESTVCATRSTGYAAPAITWRAFPARTDEVAGETLYESRSGLRAATGYGRNA